jgi:hypothetical protein
MRFMRPPGTPPIPDDVQAAMQRRTQEVLSGVVGDAILYLGPAAGLMASPSDATLVMDEAYFREIARRYHLMTGDQARFADWVERGSHPPAPYGR